MTRTLAGIVAHPDDDAYGIAALVAMHRNDPGFRFFLVHAADGGLADVPQVELVDRIAVILAKERPDVVVIFGPDGITGHPDHTTIGRADTDAFHRVANTPGPGLGRLTYGAIRQSVIAKGNGKRLADGPEPFDPDTVYHPRGVPDECIDIDTSAVAPLIRRAMLEHRTQWNDMNSPTETDEEKVGYVSRETEVIAWPAIST